MTAFLGKLASPFIVAGALLAAAALLFWLTMSVVNGMVSDARAAAISERDAHWTAELAKSDAETQKKITDNLRQTMAAQDAARDQVAEANQRADQLEIDNAALPDTGACGLGRDRVRLLNRR